MIKKQQQMNKLYILLLTVLDLQHCRPIIKNVIFDFLFLRNMSPPKKKKKKKIELEAYSEGKDEIHLLSNFL